MTNPAHKRQISLSRVAEMSNRTSQAVSNWRKRFADFPAPVAGTDRRPLFDFDEMITWLQANDRYNRPSAFAPRMWAFMDGLRAALPPSEALLAALSAVAWRSLSQKSVSKGFTISGMDVELPSWLGISPDIEEAEDFTLKLTKLDEWAKLNLRFPYGDIFSPLLRALPLSGALFMPTVIPGAVDAPQHPLELEDALDELFSRGGSSEAIGRTPALIRQFAASVLDITEGSTVLDAACGSAGFLLHVGTRHPGSRRIGVELTSHELKVAALSSVISEIPLELHSGDSITDDPVAELVADSVFIDPPWQRISNAKQIQGDPRWTFGVPTGDYDFAWLQHALARLSSHGRAAVVLPPRSLYSTPGQSIRSALIRRAAVEAVITLPKGTYPGITDAPTLWLLRAPGQDTSADNDILLIDASEADREDSEALQWVATTIAEYRRGEELTTGRPLAAKIPSMELLEGDVNLTPARWLAAPSLVDQSTMDAKIGSVQKALASLEETDFPTSVSVLHAAGQKVKVGDLVDAKSLKIIRGKAIPAKDLLDAGSVRYLTPAGLSGYLPDQEMYVDERTPETRMTQPGDIAVWASRRAVKAVVLRDGGAVPGAHLQLLRVLDGSFDPNYLAACITSAHNARFIQEGTIVRFKLQDFEVPSLRSEDQQRLGWEIQNITALQQRVARASVEIAEFSALFIDTVGDGLLRIPAQGTTGQ